MAFCPNCGGQMTDEEKFCGNCGYQLETAPAPQEASVEVSYAQPAQQSYTPPQQSYTPPQQSYTPPQQGYTPPQQGYVPPQQGYTPGTGTAAFTGNKTMAILAMIFNILFFLPLVASEKTEYDTFYANQALLLLLLQIAGSVLSAILIGIPIMIFGFVCWIIGIINVVSGQMKPLPLIGKITIIK